MTIHNKLLLASLATASVVLSASPSHALVLQTNSATDFTYYRGVTAIGLGTSPATNNPASRAGIGLNTGTLNTTSLSDGFSNFFPITPFSTEINFGRLGGQDNTVISSGFNNQTTSAQTTNLLTLAAPEASAPLYVKFAYIFAGSNPGNASNLLFQALDLSGGGSGTTYSFFSGTTLGSVPFSEFLIPANTFTAGDQIAISLSLQETGTSNTAFGFSVLQIDTVPFEFSPTLGLLAVGGLFGASAAFKRFRMKKAAN